MGNRDIIQAGIDYIEDHLKTEISAQELADKANFSLFHYYRLFHLAVGMPVMEYIMRRRLLHAIYEIGQGNKMIDVALNYGFDTYAGFYKAFKREFGYTPKQFLNQYQSKKPYRINLSQEEYNMVTHKKIAQILKNWNLEKEVIADIFYDSGERNEHAFYVGDNYVMKVFANLGNVKKHIDISKSLENFGLSAAVPMKTQDGREIVEDNQLYFTLTNRVQGERIRAADMYEGDYKSKARFVGEIIGHLSLALEKVDAVVNEVDIYERSVSWALPVLTKKTNIPEGLCKAVVDEFGKVHKNLPKQIIHRDPNPSNMIVAKDKWGFIDFDLSEKNIRIYDPCYAATAILSESFDEKDQQKLLKWVEIYKNIIYGYDGVVKLSEEELQAVPYVVLCNQLICCAWFADKEKHANIYDINMKMTRWIWEHFEDLVV